MILKNKDKNLLRKCFRVLIFAVSFTPQVPVKSALLSTYMPIPEKSGKALLNY